MEEVQVDSKEEKRKAPRQKKQLTDKDYEEMPTENLDWEKISAEEKERMKDWAQRKEKELMEQASELQFRSFLLCNTSLRNILMSVICTLFFSFDVYFSVLFTYVFFCSLLYFLPHAYWYFYFQTSKFNIVDSLSQALVCLLRLDFYWHGSNFGQILFPATINDF